MKLLTILFTIASTFSLYLRADDAQSKAPNIELRMQKLDLDIALKQYERVKMEHFKVDLDLALKNADGTEKEQKALAKKAEILAGRVARLQREIREQSERIARTTRDAQQKADANRTGSRHEEKKPAAPMAHRTEDHKAAEREMTKAQRRLDELNTELEKRSKARNEIKDGSPEVIAAADKRVHDTKSEVRNAVEALKKARDAAKEAARHEEGNPTARTPHDAAPKTQETKGTEAEIARAQKKVATLNEELEKRRKARSEIDDGGSEYAAADKRVQDVKEEIRKAGADLESLKSRVKKP